jgi:hypothetical protein
MFKKVRIFVVELVAGFVGRCRKEFILLNQDSIKKDINEKKITTLLLIFSTYILVIFVMHHGVHSLKIVFVMLLMTNGLQSHFYDNKILKKVNTIATLILLVAVWIFMDY